MYLILTSADTPLYEGTIGPAIKIAVVIMIAVLLYSLNGYYTRKYKQRKGIKEITIDITDSELNTLNDSDFRKHIEEKIKLAEKELKQ